MKNLVISVSLDSSLELLRPFADVIVLDKDPIPSNVKHYDTIYVRSHFSQPATVPQNYRREIDALVQRATILNPDLKFIDNMATVDAIVAFEDKWHQYETFYAYMPRTALLDDGAQNHSFARPVYKKRLSSRGKGVTWEKEKVTGSAKDWILQESLDIEEELRIYVIGGAVYPIGAVRQNKTPQQHTQAIASRELLQDEINFSLQVLGQFPELDIVGLDVARTRSGQLQLIEANRSPGFAKFSLLTGINLAAVLYAPNAT